MQVVPHQDSSFLITDPPSCVGLWWALEDATRDNGCLWALPGKARNMRRRARSAAPRGLCQPPPRVSLCVALRAAGVHKEGLRRRFLRNEAGQVSFDAPQPEWDLSQFEPVECPAGTLVLLHVSGRCAGGVATRVL